MPTGALRYYNPALETLSREQTLELQWQKLSYQLQYLYERNPFYRQRLDNAGVRPNDVQSLEQFREVVPFCEKGDFLTDQETSPPFGDRLGVRDDQVRMTYLTSGTSGVGQEVYGHTWSDAIASGSKYLEGPLWWIGLRKGDRVYSMTPIATLAFGLMVVEALRLGGYQSYQVFNMDSVAKLQLMQRFPVHAVVITPAHLARLTTICREQDIEPRTAYPELKAILVAGQSYPVELIQRLEEVWGAKIYETYGSSQGNGHMAATCELGAVRPDGSRGGMHIYEHRLLLEVLDPESWEHVAPGEEGMAVITNLDASGSALLRFRTNDKVRYLGLEHSTGRPWAQIEAGSISRYDDMVKVRGMNIWPQAVEDVVFSHPDIDEYVAEVSVDETGLEQIDLRYALRPSIVPGNAEDFDGLDEYLVRELKNRTNVAFRVERVARSSLPVFEFKAVRWNDHRQTDLQKQVW